MLFFYLKIISTTMKFFYFKFFNDFSNKIHFTGFVRNNFKTNELESIRITYQNLKHNKLIFVSRGGGIVNKKIILVSILLAKGKIVVYFLLFVAVQLLLQENFRSIKRYRRESKNLKLVKDFNPISFLSYLKSADLSINMAGYNTTVKMLYYGKKLY